MSTKAPTTLSKGTSLPPSVSAKMAAGVPKRTAMSTGKKPTSSVAGLK